MNAVSKFIEKGILVSPEIAKDPELVKKLALIQDHELVRENRVSVIDKAFLEKTGVLKKDVNEPEPAQEKTRAPDREKSLPDGVKIISSYNKKPGKLSMNDFVSHFNKRFQALSSILRQRQEFQDVVSIARIRSTAGESDQRTKSRIIGMVYDKRITKNKNLICELEDQSGKIKVLFSCKKSKLLKAAQELVLDEVIGVEGTCTGEIIFADKLITPGIPLNNELKKGPEEEYVAFLGDPHFGSNVFLKNEFESFIKWINQEKGSAEQKNIASKIKYIIMVGDLVEGVGIYPGQEADLAVKDIKEQYDLIAGYLKQIPSHISIIICPGNHDAGRIAEPQPPIFHKYAESLQQLPNAVLVSNPAYVNLGAKKGFSGFDFLLYHGYSLIYYADNVEHIRSSGGQKRPDLLMKFLLQKRHLAPAHTSNMYVPDKDGDPMVIREIPDFFVTGHIHRVSVNNYRHITLVNSSCWTDITEDMEKRGLQPQPAKVPVINLKTREVKIINFMKTIEVSKKSSEQDKHEQKTPE